MDRAMFDEYVNVVCSILVFVRDEWGETVADAMLNLYVNSAEARRKDLVPDLIRWSRKFRVAWGSLSLIAQDHLRKRTPLPHELADWLYRVLKGTRRQTQTRGRDPIANVFRNRIIVMCILALSGLTGKTTRNRSDLPECHYEGGSACDVVGIAWAKVYKESLSYKCIERILTERASTGITDQSAFHITITMIPAILETDPYYDFPDDISYFYSQITIRLNLYRDLTDRLISYSQIRPI